MASGNVAKRPNGQWRARYRDDGGKEFAKHFDRKTDATAWLAAQTSALETGKHVSPRHDKLTVAQWCDEWLESYSPKSDATKHQAAVDIARIKRGLGKRRLRALEDGHVDKWLSELSKAGSVAGGPLADSTVSATYARFRQVMRAAVRRGRLGSIDRVLPEKSPPSGTRKLRLVERDQLWALVDAFPEHLRLAVLLGAFAGLRNGEICGLRIEDVNPLKAEVTPRLQYGEKDLKTVGSAETIAVPRWLADEIAAHIAAGYAGESFLFRNEWGDQAAPWLLQRAMRKARRRVPGLPAGFRLHDARHFYASVMIDKNLPSKLVQKNMRHASIKTTMDVYGDLFEDHADKTRDALEDEGRPRLPNPHVDDLRA
jgi:integrase